MCILTSGLCRKFKRIKRLIKGPAIRPDNSLIISQTSYMVPLVPKSKNIVSFVGMLYSYKYSMISLSTDTELS